jgi:leucyl aminopeptidase
LPKSIIAHVTESKSYDKGFDKQVSCFKSDGKVVIYSPLDIDNYSDVREYFKSAKNGVERALKAGFKKPVIVLPSTPKFKSGELSSLLGALAALYVPIQYREAAPANVRRAEQLFVSSVSSISSLSSVIENAMSLESGLFIAR